MRTAAWVLVVAACHAELGPMPNASGPDAGIDSFGPLAPPDAGSLLDAPAVIPDNACGVAAMQGDLGDLAATGHVRLQSADSPLSVYSLGGATTKLATPDWLYVELWDGYGAFRGGAARTGTFSITGDETAYATCGVCVLTLADAATGSLGDATRILAAISGTVVVQAVGSMDGAAFQVEVRDAVFQEIDPVTWLPTGTSCTSPLQRARLDGKIGP